jgi:hypothetical protein
MELRLDGLERAIKTVKVVLPAQEAWPKRQEDAVAFVRHGTGASRVQLCRPAVQVYGGCAR